jgi:hypothetical protein
MLYCLAGRRYSNSANQDRVWRTSSRSDAMVRARQLFMMARNLAKRAEYQHISYAPTKSKRPAPASVEPNIWPKTTEKTNTLSKSSACVAAPGKRMVITKGQGGSSNAPCASVSPGSAALGAECRPRPGQAQRSKPVTQPMRLEQKRPESPDCLAGFRPHIGGSTPCELETRLLHNAFVRTRRRGAGWSLPCYSPDTLILPPVGRFRAPCSVNRNQTYKYLIQLDLLKVPQAN